MICNPASKNVLTYLGSADLQSAAKECAFSFCWGITNHKWLKDYFRHVAL